MHLCCHCSGEKCDRRMKVLDDCNISERTDDFMVRLHVVVEWRQLCWIHGRERNLMVWNIVDERGRVFEECVSHVVLFGDKKFWGSRSRWKKRDGGSRKVLCGWNVVVCEKMMLTREFKESVGLCMVVQWKRCCVICGVIDARVAKIEVMKERVRVYNGGEMLRFLWKK